MNDRLIIKKSSASLPGLFLLAVIISVVYIVLTYNSEFLWGNGAFWKIQLNDVGGHLTGLRFYVRDEWRFPLFHTKTLHYPDGANIIFTDSLPLMAVVAKILFKTTGLEWNYFGCWVIFSNIFFGLSIIVFLDSLKIRSIPVSVVALLFGFSVFPYINRTFHIALSSHFLIILALALYYRSQDANRFKGSLIWFLVLLVICLHVHFYLFAISSLIAIASLLTMCLKRRISLSQVFRYGGIATFVLLCVMFCSGYISFGSSQGYSSLGSAVGKASMNILSPVLPVHSSFFPDPPFSDPTGNQFREGLNYLGASVLILVLIVLIRHPRTVKHGIADHPLLALLCLGLFFFSLSSKIYCGSHLIAEIPLVPGVETLYKTLRASGRFFWPCIYLITLLPVAVLWRTKPDSKIILVLLFFLAIAQNVEVWPLRERIRDETGSSLKIDDYIKWTIPWSLRKSSQGETGFQEQIDYYSFYESLVHQHDLILVDNTKWIPPSHYKNTVRSLFFLSGKENKLTNYCVTARRPRNTTELKELIRQHLDGEMSVLFVIPADSEYAESLKGMPHQFERDGIIFASNRHELKQD